MEIRELRQGDMEGFVRLVSDTYEDSNFAMWFERKPSDEELEGLFGYKLRLMGEGLLLDNVAVEERQISGECEIAKVGGEWKVGIIVGKEHRRRGLGTRLLGETIRLAKRSGIKKLIAEVSEDNEGSIRFFASSGFMAEDGPGEVRKADVRVLRYSMILMDNSVV